VIDAYPCEKQVVEFAVWMIRRFTHDTYAVFGPRVSPAAVQPLTLFPSYPTTVGWRFARVPDGPIDLCRRLPRHRGSGMGTQEGCTTPGSHHLDAQRARCGWK
jgi:hypothetical protein